MKDFDIPPQPDVTIRICYSCKIGFVLCLIYAAQPDAGVLGVGGRAATDVQGDEIRHGEHVSGAIFDLLYVQVYICYLCPFGFVLWLICDEECSSRSSGAISRFLAHFSGK